MCRQGRRCGRRTPAGPAPNDPAAAAHGGPPRRTRWPRGVRGCGSSTSASALETPYGCAVSSTSSTWRAVLPYGSRLIATTMRCHTVRSSVSNAARIAAVGQNSTGRSSAGGRRESAGAAPAAAPRSVCARRQRRVARRQPTSPRLLQHRHCHRKATFPDHGPFGFGLGARHPGVVLVRRMRIGQAAYQLGGDPLLSRVLPQ